MATQTLTGLDALLKDVYRGPWVELLNNETYLVDQLEKTDVNNMGAFQGRRLVFAVHSSRNRGRHAGTDGGALVSAGTQGTLDGIATIHYFDQGIELTDQVIKQSKTDEGSFVRALTFEMDRAAGDMRKDINRVAYGNGDALLAKCTSSQGPGVTFQVDNGQYIAVGDPVDVIVRSDGTTGTGAVGRTVTTVAFTGTAASSTQTQADVTISGGNITVDNTYGVYISGSRGNEGDGLQNICQTGRILHNINSSTYPIWDANKIDAANSNPSEDTFMKLSQKIRLRSNKDIDTFLTSLGVQRRLANQYGSQKRFNDGKATDIPAGYEAIMVSAGGKATPVIADVDAPAGRVFAINKASFAWSQIGPPDWLDAPDGKGSILHLKDGSTAGTKVRAWQAWMVWDTSLICVAPNRNGQILNVNDDIPVVRDQ